VESIQSGNGDTVRKFKK